MEKQEIFVNKIKEKFDNEYQVLGNYINNHTKIKMRHCLCGYEWEVLPMTMTRKKPTRCPKCFGTPKKLYLYLKKK